MDGLRASLVVLVLMGCSPSHPPLVCDPDAAGEMALGYQVGGEFFPLSGDHINGSSYLFIDGACRYWAPSPTWGPSRAVTGILDDALLEELNDDLLTGPWAEIDGLSEEPSPDAPVAGLSRGTIVGVSADTWHTSATTFASLARRARDWSERLGALGTPSDGPVRLEIRRWPTDFELPSVTVAWPLSTPLATLLPETPYAGVAHVLEDEDAAMLRIAAEAASVTTEGELEAQFRISDVLPFAMADGCLRPIFAGFCSVQQLW
jgi:hypothetical protein